MSLDVIKVEPKEENEGDLHSDASGADDNINCHSGSNEVG